jgi:hypothetical protein
LLRAVRRRLATAALAFAWLCANGAVWDAVQVVAWGRMFSANAGSMDLSTALRETFNPKKACALCVGVHQAKEQARTQLPAPADGEVVKIVLMLHVVEAPLFGSDPGDWVPTSVLGDRERRDPVPLRPPRGVVEPV